MREPAPAGAGSDRAPPLAPADAFRLWAPTYERETGLSALEDRAVRELTPELAGRSILDVGCGTGRRLRDALAGGAALAVGVDLVPEMLRRAEPLSRGRPHLVVADVRALPVPAGRFDVVWCRLTIGFLADAEPPLRQLARAVRPGGCVLVTDLHPDSGGPGRARRTFRDGAGALHSVRHHLHPANDQIRLARAAGLRLERRVDAEVGPEIRRFYEESGALDRYEEDRGTPAALALLFIRDGG